MTIAASSVKEPQTKDTAFKRELSVFEGEVTEGTDALNAFLVINKIAREHTQVHKFLNRTPLFWNTCVDALQTTTIMTLGRIFDRKSAHNLNVLIGMAQNNLSLFSKVALGKRRHGKGSKPPEWMDELLQAAYEPTILDFNSIAALVYEKRTVYEKSYRNLRHKWFAHKAVSEPTEVAELFFKNTNTVELTSIFGFLSRLHDELFQLFFNGKKLDLERLRHPTGEDPSSQEVERITRETERLLMAASKPNP
jgi:AbiU2